MHRVGLCMIVKNEAHVIERCLNSVRPHIDHWVVVDTGSTDGTQELIRELLRDVPGFLLERPWRDFAHNRTEALQAARPHAKYSFVIDADEEFVVPPGFGWPDLAANVDLVNLLHRTENEVYWRASLVANRLPWRYVGVLHEYLESEDCRVVARLAGPEVVGYFEGGRGQGITVVEKYARDASTLEAALLDEPHNARYQYYLATSYVLCEQFEAALAAFRRRVEMGGQNQEEIWHALFSIARLLERDASVEEVAAAYRQAWEYRPSRAETLYHLALYYRQRDLFEFARNCTEVAAGTPFPESDSFRIDRDVYEWACLDEFAVLCYLAGSYQECADACRELLENRRLPEEDRPRVAQNLAAAQAELPGDRAAPQLPRQMRPAPGPSSDRRSLRARGTRRPSRYPRSDS